MMIGDRETTSFCVGIKAIADMFEVHAVNLRREVVLSGWFPREIVMAVVADRPKSLIMLDGGTISSALSSFCEESGHSVVVVRPSKDVTGKKNSASAKEFCEHGMEILTRLN